ncbi:archaeoflavoprotein AfpA [Methanobacterium paludis]|uniref:Archaeoflavoprotein AfpA n=1 Tax=Methanobacterium paludis (strain DSM 25820 / JCM 18151 / SWAN1) TaxID=868131 RepID=F6D489_METPW|nr:archaeoflavoprotein AfpA [Methanobacterium paludis]AEG18088.1 archaeoflavoprotein AfpA [Methanobacterium paludis]
MKKRKIAWGITGAGDKVLETIEVMKKIKKEYEDQVDIEVFISKSGDQVVKYYGIANDIETNFDKIWVEINANAPFLAGNIQLGKYEFMLIAPATSNTVAKIAMRMGDTLISNAAIMGQKADVPIYILPSDYEEGVTITKLPDGDDLKITIRKEDVEHVKKLVKMYKTFVLKEPDDIAQVFAEYFV